MQAFRIATRGHDAHIERMNVSIGSLPRRRAVVALAAVAALGASCARPAARDSGSLPAAQAAAEPDSAAAAAWAALAIAPGDRVRVDSRQGLSRWREGTVVAFERDTLRLARGDRVDALAMRDMREVWVATGRGISAGRAVAATLGGLVAGIFGGFLAAELTDPCADDQGEICLDGFGYGVAGAGVGLVVGLAVGLLPGDQWALAWTVDKNMPTQWPPIQRRPQHRRLLR
jgi:hypothetical protein